VNESSLPTQAYLLVVEDSRIQAKILSEKLQESGYEVRTAENGQVGLEMIRQERPALVISDIEMPTMTGHELCKAVKSDSTFRTIPFILLSTLSEAEDIIKGLHCGADNYVTKPYDPAYLLSRVESLLQTPLADDEDEQQMDVTLGGKRYTVKAGRQQVLNLLISTFENAVEKNDELARTNEELTVVKEQLTRWNQDLKTLNEQLDSANARMSRDLEAAARIQQSLLPAADLQEPRAKVAWKYLPCDELAGDFLNVFPLDERHIALYVVDVSGHGVASSLLSVTIGRVMTPTVSSTSLLVQRREGTDEVRVVPPAEVADELNRRFPVEDQGGLFFTMAYGVLDLETLEFRFASAGHDPIVHAPRDGIPSLLEEGGLPIGIVDGMDYEDQVIQLQPGDRIFLYSDGVPEAMDENLEQFSMQQMLDIMELGQSRGLEDSVSLLLSSVERWCAKNGPKDDVTILGLEISDSH
jgi:sigma-B regulation protein RsbU (phosphoserine phosphatase)